MDAGFAMAVYETLYGVRMTEDGVPGVENLFADGMPCAEAYEQMLKAYERLRDRLGTVDEDADAEVMINALLNIFLRMSMKMFEYGGKFAQER